MRTKREATELKDRLEEQNPGSEYAVFKDSRTLSPRLGPWYVKRTKRPKKEA